MKTCTACLVEKSTDEFHFDSFNGRFAAQCKPCRVQKQIVYQRSEAGKAKQRRAALKHKYGLTVEQYAAMLEAQDGCCAICGLSSTGNSAKQNFSVDHDHSCCPGYRSCGKCIRGLLCLRCNSNLGWLEKQTEKIENYLA